MFCCSGEHGMVCKLKKTIYGLRQSPREWFGKFSAAVIEFGMKRCIYDPSMFYYKGESGKRLFLVVYVDDIGITGDDNEGIQALK